MKQSLFENVNGNTFKLKEDINGGIRFDEYIPIEVAGKTTREIYVNFEVEIGHCEPVDQGRYSGSPENCYPASGGDIEMGDIKINSIGNGRKIYNFNQLNPTLQSTITKSVTDFVYNDRKFRDKFKIAAKTDMSKQSEI